MQAGRLPEVGGPAVARSVAQRLTALGPDAEALARDVAILGTNVEPRHAHALAGLGELRGAVATDALAAAGVLGSGRPLDFVHPLVRAAAVEHIAPAERAQSHLAAARTLDAEGADAERTAPHLLACDSRADPWVVDVLRRAATRSVDRGAPEAAVRYLTRALEEPPTVESMAAVLAELGRAEVRAALPDQAVWHLRQAVVATDDPRERAAMAQDLAIGLVAPGRYQEAVSMLEDAVEAARETDPELGRRLEAELSVRSETPPPDGANGGPPLRATARDLPGDTAGERMLLGTLAHELLMRGGRAGEVAEFVARALDRGLLEEQTGDSGIVLDAGFALGFAGELDRADRFWNRAFDVLELPR